MEDGSTAFETDGIELRGEFRALVIVGQLEQRNFIEQAGFGPRSCEGAAVGGPRSFGDKGRAFR